MTTEPDPKEAFDKLYNNAPSSMKKFTDLVGLFTERQMVLNHYTAGDLTVLVHNMLFSGDMDETEAHATKQLIAHVMVHVIGVLVKLDFPMDKFDGAEVSRLMESVHVQIGKKFVVSERVDSDYWQGLVHYSRKMEEAGE